MYFSIKQAIFQSTETVNVTYCNYSIIINQKLHHVVCLQSLASRVCDLAIHQSHVDAV